MIAHTLTLGERVFNIDNGKWGKIVRLPNRKNKFEVNEKSADYIVILAYEVGEEEVEAQWCYQVANGRYFWGNEVCYEHFKDKFEKGHDYDFFCPNREENCFDFECY